MTERKTTDYLHFYIGAECMIGDLNWRPQNIHPSDLAPYTDPEYFKPIRTKISLHSIQAYAHNLTPILRPLSDMTEEEANILKAMDIRPDESVFKKIEATATMNNWLRKNGFDIDGLIESELAIDKSTLKP